MTTTNITRWTDIVDAGPVRQRLAELRGMGLHMDEIAAATGLGTSTLWQVNSPRRQHVYRHTAEALQNMRPRVRRVGSQRRLRALAMLGWSPHALADMHPDMSRSTLVDVRSGAYLCHDAATHDAIAALYDRLWNVEAPRNRATSTVRAHARRQGWAPPLAWDDDTIDDPTAEPTGVGPTTRSPAAQEAAWRLALGERLETIARDLGVELEYLARVVSEAA